MQNKHLPSLCLVALLVCSVFVAFAAAEDQVDQATPDPSVVDVTQPPEPTKDPNVGSDGVTSSNATDVLGDGEMHILDDNSSEPYIAPGPRGDGSELMYANGLAEDNTQNNILPIVGLTVAVIAIAGAAVGLVYYRKQSHHSEQ